MKKNEISVVMAEYNTKKRRFMYSNRKYFKSNF